MKPVMLITIDVEDWFQVENFKGHIDFSEWHLLPSRVCQSTRKLLELFDSQHVPIKATFYILGWIAEKYPELVREISQRGHEVASHGYTHCLCDTMADAAMFHDLEKSKKVLEEITGKEVAGYRAPSFSINDTVLALIQKAGYRYDSSYNSFSYHSRYGSIKTTGLSRQGIVLKIKPGFYELPVSNLKICNQIIPWAGGGYFRLLPFWLFKRGVQSILNKQRAYIFYAHPWEFDPQQPRVKNLKKLSSFRHYLNLGETQNRLEQMITHFHYCEFITSMQYLERAGCM